MLLPKYVYGKPSDEDASEEDATQKISFSAILKGIPKAHREWVEKIYQEMGLPDMELMINRNTTITMPQKAIQVCLEEKIPLFCAGLGSPGFMVEDAHDVGTKVLAITGNVKNAKRMAQTGIDLLVAQGHEAGGHTGRIGTLALIPQVIDAAGPVPILAAGGIGDGRGLAAALAMGCIGVWVGTRFLVTNEGGAQEVSKRRIIESTDEDTRVSRAYTGKTARASYNRFHDIWDDSGLESLPFPTQVLISSALLASFHEAEKYEYVGGFAGQVSGLIKEIKPAGQVLEDMVEEAVDILTRKLPENVIAK